MYTATCNQGIGQWAPSIVYTPLPYTGEAVLPYMVYKLVWEERPVEEFVLTPLLSEESSWADLYALFADEDHELAQMGLTDYIRQLREEETRYEAR